VAQVHTRLGETDDVIVCVRLSVWRKIVGLAAGRK
jgi:hypothetical protein